MAIVVSCVIFIILSPITEHNELKQYNNSWDISQLGTDVPIDSVSEQAFITVSENNNAVDVTSGLTDAQSEVAKETQSIKQQFRYYTEFYYNNRKVSIPLSKSLQKHTFNMAQKYGVGYELMLALFGCESSWHTASENKNGCIGLGQIHISNLPKLNREIGITDLRDPYQNIEASCYILSNYMKYNSNDTSKALMGYHLSQAKANEYFAQNVYETAHTIKIMAYYKALRMHKINIIIVHNIQNSQSLIQIK